MRSAHRFSCYTCVFLFALPWPAGAAPAVELERVQGVFRVRAETPVAADLKTAWQVLTDYDHLAEFVPDMRVSRLVSAAGEPRLLQQRGEAGFLFFKSVIDVTLAIEEAPPSLLAFRAVSGNMKRMHGQWQLSAAGDGITLKYEAQFEPDFWVPPLLGNLLVQRDISRQIAGVVAEMVRRYTARRDRAALGDPGAPVK